MADTEDRSRNEYDQQRFFSRFTRGPPSEYRAGEASTVFFFLLVR
jgi:hypothetical protein